MIVKALTICQPYAGAIMDGRKRVENRGWRTNYRGPVIIHAGKSLQWMKTWNDETDGPLPSEMPLGAVVGTAELTAVYIKADVVSQFWDPECTHKHKWIADHRHASGPFIWVLENVRRLVTPIECNGKQGLWNPTELIASPEWQSAEFIDVEPMCEFCRDPDGVCCFPYYGMAPHTHDLRKTGSVFGSTVILPKSEWPDNFEPDPDAEGCGTYTRCPKCGAGESKDDAGTEK